MSKLQVEVVDEEVQELSGTSKAGKPYSMKLQKAYLHNGGAYPEGFEVILPRRSDGTEPKAYAKGFYPFKVEPRVFNGRINCDVVLEGKPTPQKLS